MTLEFREPQVLTLVSVDEMTAQFREFDNFEFEDARLVSDWSDSPRFMVRVRSRADVPLGRVGALLLWLNEFGFRYLGEVASSFRRGTAPSFTLNCKDTENYYPGISPEEFTRLIQENATEREFFMEDDEHRFMSGEIAENWIQPDQIDVLVEFMAVNPAYGTVEHVREIHYCELISEWRQTQPRLVLLEAYERRLKAQSPLNH